jgi:phosphatidylserine decarboxylase
MITKYGYTTVGTIAIVVFIVIISSFFISNHYIKYSFITISAIFFAFTLNFFRDPDRTTPSEKNLLISPADGEVIDISVAEENIFLNGISKKVSIFMSPLDVHVNRIPMDGKIDYLKYHEGENLVAFDDKSSDKNERMEIGMTNKYGKILFKQIAGFIARRIVCTLTLGQSVKAGERFGMIKFGSRVDIYMPVGAEILISMNQNVYAGETVIAKFNN